MLLPGRAEEEDRRQKAAWYAPGTKFRAAYASMLRLPERVMPGDRAAAGEILDRVMRVMEVKGRWTRAERTRLRRMKKAWRRRAAGGDSTFNLIGWQQRGAADWQKKDWEMAEVGRALDKVRDILEDAA